MQRLKLAFALVSAIGLAQVAYAQGDPNYILRFTDGAGGASGGTATITTVLNFSGASQNIAGWSFGVCHPSAALDPVDAVAGATTLIVNGGSPPSFIQINVIENGTEPAGSSPGVNMGVVISFTGGNPLPPGDGYELLDITYELTGPDGPVTVDYCEETIGATGPVSVVMTPQGGGSSITPTQLPGSIEIGAIIPPLLRIADDLVINGTADISVFMDHVEQDVYGFSFGVLHDNAVVNLTGITEGAQTASADFFGVDIDPANGDGGTVGCVLSLSGGPSSFIPSGSDSEIAVFSYSTAGGAVTDDSSALTFTDTLQVAPGAPPVLLQVSVGIEGIEPDVDNGLITVTGGTVGDVFTRGDVNDDSAIDVSDTVYLLNFLFVSGPALNCDKAGDVNDDGTLDVSDSVYLLNFLFVSGDPIPAPVACDVDPTADALTCGSSSCP